MRPRIEVDAGDRIGLDRALRRALGRRVRRIARAMGCTRAQIEGLTVRIVDDAAMRALKARHLGLDEATDVLAFPAAAPIPGEDEEADAEALGDLVLNRDAVARQATGPGVRAWLDEATSLLVHGLAHLRGHDHDRRDRARRMLALERRGCAAVGLPCQRPYGDSRPYGGSGRGPYGGSGWGSG